MLKTPDLPLRHTHYIVPRLISTLCGSIYNGEHLEKVRSKQRLH